MSYNINNILSLLKYLSASLCQMYDAKQTLFMIFESFKFELICLRFCCVLLLAATWHYCRKAAYVVIAF